MKNTNTSLVQRIKEGSKLAFDELYSKYFDKIYTLSYAKLASKEDAEETTQDIFLNVFLSIDKFKNESSVLTWLYGIAKHIITDKLKERLLHRTVPLDLLREKLEVKTLSPDKIIIRREKISLIHQAIALLSKDQSKAIYLYYFGQYSVKEISQMLSRSQTAVTSLLSRAYKKLAKILEKQGFNYKDYEKENFARYHFRAFPQRAKEWQNPRY